MAQVSSTSGSNQAEQQTYNDPNVTNAWWNLLNSSGALANWIANNNPSYPGGVAAQVAPPTDLTNQFWNEASQNANAPSAAGTQNWMADISGWMNQNQAPESFNIQPGQNQLPTTFANGAPQVTAPQGIGSTAAAYQYNPQQVSGMMVSAPTGVVNPISGLAQVNAPSLQNYQMTQPANVNAPNLSQFTMQAAAPVSANAVSGPQSWTTPGTAQQYMSPYTQNVVDTQLAQAQVQEQQQLQQQKGQAAQAGAFGGSREAVEEANTSLGYQQMAAGLEAQGLQSAYQQGMGQFTQEQAMGQQAQMANQQAGLQAALANQQAQQQANVQNLSSFLQTQGLGAQTGLQAALANQSTGLATGQTNLQALLQTQGLGAQMNMQGQLANQSVGLQAALANQQAQEFTAGQQMQASLANQGVNMQGQLANQSAGLQAGLAAQQMGQAGAEFNAQQQMQTGLANQAANMQAMGMEYQGGLQSALQTQALGLQGQMANAQFGLAGTNMNNANLMNQANIALQSGQFGLGTYQAGLMGQGALGQAAQGQQGYQQQIADTQYQDWLNSMQMPLQAYAYQAQLMNMMPSPGTTTTSQDYTTSQTDQPTNWMGLAGGIIGAAASAFTGGLGGGLGMGMGLGSAGGGLGDVGSSAGWSDASFMAKGGLLDAEEEKPHFDDGGLADVIPFRRRRVLMRRKPIMEFRRRHEMLEPMERAAYRTGLGQLGEEVV